MHVLALLAATTALPTQAQQRLLTGNGLTNPAHSEYGAVEQPAAGGRYHPDPPFASHPDSLSATFAEGALTNGDSTFDHRREPTPYGYWQGVRRAELRVDLGRRCRIDRVRLCVLSRDDGPHGTQRVDVHVLGDPLEFPDVLRVGALEPVVGGWNELAVGRQSDGLRLIFAAAPAKTYITVSEVEVWGEPLGPEVVAPAAGADGPARTEDGITWWAFDFGPADSPAFARFHVVDSRTVYAPERGFGWVPYRDGQPATESNFGPASTDVPGLGERDRGGAIADALYRDLLMTSEYYHTQVRQTFALNVPNGRYRVMTMHGDFEYGRVGKQPYWIEAEGQTVVENLELPWSRATDAVFETTVQDGRLDLTLDARHPDPAQRGFAINGLAVFPSSTDPERALADRKVELIRAAVRRAREEAFEAQFTAVPHEETAVMVDPTADDRRRGFIAWTPSWMDRLFPNTVPEPADVQRACAAFATPGEYEPLAVAVRALRPLSAVRVAVGDLVGEGGRVFAGEIDVRKVRCWPQRLGSSWSKEYQVMPELLERFEAVDVPADTTQEFWLTVRVPDDAAPGLYRGPLRIADGAARPWETTVTLEVLPFRLSPAERSVGMYWRDEQAEPEELDRQVRDMVAHGITAVTLSRLPTVRAVDGRAVADTGELLAFLRRLRQLGLRGPIPYGAGLEGLARRAVLGGDQEALYVDLIRQLEAVSSREDALPLLYYPVDEIGNDEERGRTAAHLCSLIGQVEGATSYVTVNDYAAGERWGESFDIWCGNVEYAAEQEQRLLARGKRYMRYGPAYLNSCRKARNSSGFGFYRRPAEAHYYWHYQAYNGDPFNDFDGDARDWCAAYPGPDGPIPTLDWEAIREGIDDLRYIATLNAAAARCEAGEARQRELAARARAELADLLALDDSVNQYDFADNLTDDEFNNLRRRLAERIGEMLEASR